MFIRSMIFVVLLGGACAHATLPEHNYADGFITAVDPDADVLARSGQTVIAREGTQLIVCVADAKHRTACALVADWSSRPTPQPAGTKPAAEPPVQPPKQALDK